MSLAKKGDIIHINYEYLEDAIICCRVENNDPDDEKIFLALYYNKEKHTCEKHEVLRYNDRRLRNFKVINTYNKKPKEESGICGILQDRLDVAILDENYEEAEKLKQAIEILKK